ncbi:MAG: TlpA family protein disulfide reductase [Bacteroidales bacterium]|nr:TlpA family protein disulfide reductase [Bacteroidales bacterium]
MFTDFTIEEEDGTKVKLSDYVGKGKYMLVDFWASWCGPCKREMPYIKAAYDQFHGPKFDILSVAVWDEIEDTKKAAPEFGIVWNQIVNGQHIPTDLYGIQGIPHLILFGPDGTILKRGLRGEAIAEELAKYI